MEILKVSVEFNDYTYWIIGDPLNSEEMKDSVINEVLVRHSTFGVDYEDIEPNVKYETISLGTIYVEDNLED